MNQVIQRTEWSLSKMGNFQEEQLAGRGRGNQEFPFVYTKFEMSIRPPGGNIV